MTRRNKLDYFPFFPKDCETDESIRLMDDAELGFWVRLMCYQWPNGSVPSDVETLLRGLYGTAPGGIPRTAAYVRKIMGGPVAQRMLPHPTREGRLADPRLLKEREIAETLSTGRSKNGKTGATSRWQNDDFAITESEDSKSVCHTIASVSVSVSKSKSSLMDRWAEFKELYPAHRLDEEPACRAFLSRDDEADAILAGLRLAAASKEWAESDGKYVPLASKFIFDGKYKDLARFTPANAAPAFESTMDPETRRRIEAARK